MSFFSASLLDALIFSTNISLDPDIGTANFGKDCVSLIFAFSAFSLKRIIKIWMISAATLSL